MFFLIIPAVSLAGPPQEEIKQNPTLPEMLHIIDGWPCRAPEGKICINDHVIDNPAGIAVPVKKGRIVAGVKNGKVAWIKKSDIPSRHLANTGTTGHVVKKSGKFKQVDGVWRNW